jgi:tRNA(Ile)-lysidine synthase
VLASVEDTIRRHAMLAGGETVLAAVSGGADSVALLLLLHRLAPEWRLSLHVLYVDHQLRPHSARDGEGVRRLAARFAVPADAVAATVAPGGSREAAARVARYRALEDHADRIGAHRIAVAHTADDQAETVLMRLLAGSGVRGLAGIPPTRGRIIRPLLAERREALRALLVGAGIEWIEDPSNADRAFLRNRVRHELLPVLREAYNPEIVGALVRLAGRARSTTSAVEDVAARELGRLARVGPAELILPLIELQALPGEIAAEVLRQGAVRLGGRASLRAWAHGGLRRALVGPAPRRAFSLDGVTVEVSGDRLRLGRGPASSIESRAVPVPGTLPLPEAGVVLEVSVGSPEACVISLGRWCVVFDADALSGPLLVRSRRTGDRMTPFGATEERRVKRLLIEARLPRWERGRVPIVQAGPHIVWIGGVRRGAMAPVTAATRRVLQLTLAPLPGVSNRIHLD